MHFDHFIWRMKTTFHFLTPTWNFILLQDDTLITFRLNSFTTLLPARHKLALWKKVFLIVSSRLFPGTCSLSKTLWVRRTSTREKLAVISRAQFRLMFCFIDKITFREHQGRGTALPIPTPHYSKLVPVIWFSSQRPFRGNFGRIMLQFSS